jgi:hypothetical protein
LHLAAIIARVHEYAKDEERNRERHHAKQPHPPVDSKGQDKGDQQKGDGAHQIGQLVRRKRVRDARIIIYDLAHPPYGILRVKT